MADQETRDLAKAGFWPADERTHDAVTAAIAEVLRERASSQYLMDRVDDVRRVVGCLYDNGAIEHEFNCGMITPHCVDSCPVKRLEDALDACTKK